MLPTLAIRSLLAAEGRRAALARPPAFVCQLTAVQTTWRGTKRLRGRPGGCKGASKGAAEREGEVVGARAKVMPTVGVRGKTSSPVSPAVTSSRA